ncbi:MAG: hypothetical protein OER22_15115 [Gammaproteobacteria bacterium]|nr:hypothetical protein [Gammaproteobacteria bacterium]
MGIALIFLGSLLALIWGVAHLFPTKSVVRGFGSISQDNKNIVLMEWIVEGIALVFVGILVATVTLIDPMSPTSTATYIISAGFLLLMAVVSFFTGFRIKFTPFRLCPVIFSASAGLITIGWMTI